jgi:hypothetical protein
VRWVEVAITVTLGLLGLRSLVHWLRTPFAGEDGVDHALFALFVLGRVGVWWSLAGLFAIDTAVSGHLRGRALTDEIRTRFWWYPVVVIAFTALQFVAGVMLGRRAGPVRDDPLRR